MIIFVHNPRRYYIKFVRRWHSLTIRLGHVLITLDWGLS